jgi:hypothetical protein
MSNIKRPKKVTQAQRLYNLERALNNLYLSNLTLQEKLNRLELHTGLVKLEETDSKNVEKD